jgi:hypothetical protein
VSPVRILQASIIMTVKVKMIYLVVFIRNIFLDWKEPA